MVWSCSQGIGEKPRSGHLQDSIPDLVDQIAPKVAVLREIFPDIEIGGIEPVTGKKPSEIEGVANFAELFHKKPGVYPAASASGSREIVLTFTTWLLAMPVRV